METVQYYSCVHLMMQKCNVIQIHGNDGLINVAGKSRSGGQKTLVTSLGRLTHNRVGLISS